MPHCEKQDCEEQELGPREVVEDVETGEIICETCAEDVDVVAVSTNPQSLVLGREFDYEVSYTRKEGFRAGVRLGGASLSFEVNQSELDRTFGPAK